MQLQFKEPITSSGAIMTLPAATADLKDWIADRRKFLSIQFDDWMQVIGDFRDSVVESRPKLKNAVTPLTSRVDSLLLLHLFSSTTRSDGSLSYAIDATVRAEVLQQLEQLANELVTEAAIIAAWRDLVKAAEQRARTSEQISFRRDTLYAIALGRNLDVAGSFGTFEGPAVRP